MSTQLAQIAKRAKLDRKVRFTSLAHLLTPEFLRETWGMINRHGAGGVDGESIEQFESTLEQRLRDICERLKAGAYRAPPVRRVEIPKGPGKTGTRPLGIPTVADRLLQKAVARILEAIFEADFRDASYGYRPGRSPHDALRALREQIVTKKVSYVFEADIRGYLDTASYYPQGHAVGLNSCGWRSNTLIRSPFCLPRTICTASSSPRLTRCNTVWRETLSTRIASRMGRKSSPASPLK